MAVLKTLFLLGLLSLSTASYADEVPYPPEFYKNFKDLSEAKKSLVYFTFFYEETREVPGAGPGIGGTPGGNGHVVHTQEWLTAGEGVVVGEDDSNYYVLTAGHVLESHPDSYLQFKFAGRRSHLIPFNMVRTEYVRGTMRDYALVSFSKNALKGYPDPTVVALATTKEELPMAKTDYVVVPMQGHFTYTQVRENRGDRFTLKIFSYPGISGSPVYNMSGTSVLGIVLTLDAEAVPAADLRSWLPKSALR